MASKQDRPKNSKRRPKRFFGPPWSRFNDERSSKKAAHILLGNHVSLRVPAGSTERFAVEEIARNASRSIPLESLCDELNGSTYIRGAVFFGPPGDKLDQIARNHADMQWWISDKGLNVAILPAEDPELSPFDRLAGSLTAEHWIDGKLSDDALYKIAEALDDAAFTFARDLQPAQRQPIAQHNSKFSRSPIKTFKEAVQKRTFVRLIRRRLYVARARFEKALLQAAQSRLID